MEELRRLRSESGTMGEGRKEGKWRGLDAKGRLSIKYHSSMLVPAIFLFHYSFYFADILHLSLVHVLISFPKFFLQFLIIS